MSIYCFVAKNAYCTCWKWWEFNKRPASNNHPPWVSAHSQGPKIHKRPRAIYWISKYKNWEDKNTICSKTWYIIRWVKSEEFFPSLFNWYVKLQYCLEVQHQQCYAPCVISLTIKNLLISPTWEWILYGSLNPLTLIWLQFVLYPSIPYGNVALYSTSVLGLVNLSVV